VWKKLEGAIRCYFQEPFNPNSFAPYTNKSFFNLSVSLSTRHSCPKPVTPNATQTYRGGIQDRTEITAGTITISPASSDSGGIFWVAWRSHGDDLQAHSPNSISEPILAAWASQQFVPIPNS